MVAASTKAPTLTDQIERKNGRTERQMVKVKVLYIDLGRTCGFTARSQRPCLSIRDCNLNTTGTSVVHGHEEKLSKNLVTPISSFTVPSHTAIPLGCFARPMKLVLFLPAFEKSNHLNAPVRQWLFNESPPLEDASLFPAGLTPHATGLGRPRNVWTSQKVGPRRIG